jgi:hypothetical protein
LVVHQTFCALDFGLTEFYEKMRRKFSGGWKQNLHGKDLRGHVGQGARKGMELITKRGADCFFLLKKYPLFLIKV